MINRENLIKTGRAGGNTSNRETPDQIGRVGMSAVFRDKERSMLKEEDLYTSIYPYMYTKFDRDLEVSNITFKLSLREIILCHSL